MIISNEQTERKQVNEFDYANMFEIAEMNAVARRMKRTTIRNNIISR